MAQALEDASPAVREARLLLREYSHRINNEFASAISAGSIAARRSATDEMRSALAIIEDQSFNYAQVHHVLQMPWHSSEIDAAAYLRAVRCTAAWLGFHHSEWLEPQCLERGGNSIAGADRLSRPHLG